MSNLIWQVQQHLQNKLKTNQLISTLKIGVYHQVPKNAPFPYIYLGKFMVIDESLKERNRYQFICDVYFFVQDMLLERILIIVEQIKSSLVESDVVLPSSNICVSRFKQMELDVMNDAKTYRVISKFELIVDEIV